MEVIDSPELADETYKWIIQRVHELTVPARSAGIHLTELIYCLTGSYYNRIMPLPDSKQGALTKALGIGMERVFIPEDKRAKPGTCEGIDYSPDFWFRGDTPSELKTTRMSTRKTITRSFPETWQQQIKGYCYAEKKLEYGLSIVHLMGGYKPPFPEILAIKFKFTQQELDDNWTYMLWRKKAYIDSFADQVAPSPKKWCQSWECKNCPYSNSTIHCNLTK